MDSALTTAGLPLALGIIMFGLGLDLTIADFTRVGHAPKAVAVALACQVLPLPAICFGLVILFDLPALLGIGMLLLAVFTLPLITGLAIAYYDRQDDVTMPLVEIVRVFALILLPAGIGMLVNNRAPDFARRMDKPVRIGSAVILAILVVGILLDQLENVGDYLADVGLIAALFLFAALWGMWVSRQVADREGVPA